MPRRQDPLEEIRAIFAALSGAREMGSDTTGSMRESYITLQGLRAACKAFNIRLSDGEIRLMLTVAEKSGLAGAVGFEEFARIMRRTAWF